MIPHLNNSLNPKRRNQDRLSLMMTLNWKSSRTSLPPRAIPNGAKYSKTQASWFYRDRSNSSKYLDTCLTKSQQSKRTKSCKEPKRKRWIRFSTSSKLKWSKCWMRLSTTLSRISAQVITRRLMKKWYNCKSSKTRKTKSKVKSSRPLTNTQVSLVNGGYAK